LARLYLLRRALHLEEELEMLLDGYWLDHGLQTLLQSSQVVSVAQRLEKAGLSHHAQIAALESCTYMRSQLLHDADWASMAHGLEIRVPLVDSQLLQQVAPWVASANPPTKRDLARCVGAEIAVLTNRRKTGFTTPVRDWAMAGSGNLAHGLRGYASEVHRRFRSFDLHEAMKVPAKRAA